LKLQAVPSVERRFEGSRFKELLTQFLNHDYTEEDEKDEFKVLLFIGRIPKKSVVLAIIIEKYSLSVNPRPHGAKAPRYIWGKGR